MSLYKTSDASGQANLSVLASLIKQHGSESKQVNAFMDKYRSSPEQMSRIADYLAKRFLGEEE